MKRAEVPKITTVQKICKVAKGEGEVRGMLDATWEEPKKGEEILSKAMERNKDLYKFEKMLEESR